MRKTLNIKYQIPSLLTRKCNAIHEEMPIDLLLFVYNYLTCRSKLNPILLARGCGPAPAAAAAANRLIAGGPGLGPPEIPLRCSPKLIPWWPSPWF